MKQSKSIAIIGEGETEWFYFDSLRIACRYPFRIAPDMPQHSDIPHMAKMAEQYIAREYDSVICLVDMDRLLANRTEMASYIRIKKSSSDRILWIETSPCTEFWFLLHFLPEPAIRHFTTCDEVVAELQKYMPGYEKTRRYFRKTVLFDYLRANGDLDRAMKHADQLARLSEESPADRIAYSQINRVLNLLSQWNTGNLHDEAPKPQSPYLIGEVESKIIDFLANSNDSDAKSIACAIGLRLSRTNDYLRRVVESGIIERSDGWRKIYRLKRSED